MRGTKFGQILGIQILFLCGVILGYPCYLTHLLASQGLELLFITISTAVKKKKLPQLKLKNKHKYSLYMLVLSIALPVYHSYSLFREEFLMLWVASAVVRYLDYKRQPATITYGEALACSFAEGFLFQVVPPGGDYDGLVAAIAEAEESRRIVFPVRRLFVVFPRSLYCPRNLDAFNKNDKSLPWLELCESLPEIRRDVAGVRNRVYQNTVYKIRRQPADPRPVHVVCATPINTLWMVLQKRAVYTPMATADADEIATAFCATLPAIIRNSPELRGKCDLVYYDDTNPNENLAETLLTKILEIQPNYENITREQ